MSKVAITGNAAGTGTFTIAAPGTNTDRTITLPDQTGTLVMTDASGGLTLDAAVNRSIRVNTPTNSAGYLSVYQNTAQLAVNRDGANGNFANSSLSAATLILDGSSGGSYIGFNTASANNTAPTERARIDSSGNLLVGTTSNPNSAKIAVGPTSSNGISIESTSTSVVMSQLLFRNPNGIVGSVTTNGSSTSYNTSSDYRLKEDIAPMTGALAKVQALKPCTYKWKADGSDGEGFIAHELAEVVPQCVTGEKDAVDEDGKPVYQGIDTSFLVATLTAAIQEQQALIQSLTQRIDALEGASDSKEAA